MMTPCAPAADPARADRAPAPRHLPRPAVVRHRQHARVRVLPPQRRYQRPQVRLVFVDFWEHLFIFLPIYYICIEEYEGDEEDVRGTPFPAPLSSCPVLCEFPFAGQTSTRICAFPLAEKRQNHGNSFGFCALCAPIFALPGAPQIRVIASAICAPILRREKKFYHKIKRMGRALASIEASRDSSVFLP